MRKFLLSLSLTALAFPAVAQDLPIAGDYQLVGIDRREISGTPTARIEEDGSISGEGPCNRYRAANSAKLPGLLYVNMISTRRACLVEGGEGDFHAALAAVRHVARDGDDLVMTGPGVRIRWRPGP